MGVEEVPAGDQLPPRAAAEPVPDLESAEPLPGRRAHGLPPIADGGWLSVLNPNSGLANGWARVFVVFPDCGHCIFCVCCFFRVVYRQAQVKEIKRTRRWVEKAGVPCSSMLRALLVFFHVFGGRDAALGVWTSCFFFGKTMCSSTEVSTSTLLPTFWGEGSGPTKIDRKNKSGTYSKLSNLDLGEDPNLS